MESGTSSRAHRISATLRQGETVTPLELFFDLVFVLAITQCTQLMADDPSWEGIARGLLVLAVLWWSWIGYAWLTSVVDPEEGAVRLVIFAAMAGLLVCSLAVPAAFEETAFEFAVAYALVRAAHIALFWIASHDDPKLRASTTSLGVSTAIACAVLFGASFLDGAAQGAAWVVAILIDFGGPYVFRSEGWKLVPQHFAERHGLIVIIALGESIIAVGVGVTDLPLTVPIAGAALLGLAVSVALWWLYFDVVAPVAERELRRRTGEDRVRLARDSYTYLHFPMVAGVIYLALGLKKVAEYVGDASHHTLADPLPATALWALYGGVAAYLIAHLAFRLRNIGSVNRPRAVVAGLVLVAPLAVGQLPALAQLGILAAVLVALIVFEFLRYAEARAAIREQVAHHH
jgi:low temperature requirement protein LtrA